MQGDMRASIGVLGDSASTTSDDVRRRSGWDGGCVHRARSFRRDARPAFSVRSKPSHPTSDSLAAENVGPVVRAVLERQREGSTPGARNDPYVICLSIEGGGLRAAATAGMCVLLEAAGLTAAFDRIYGVSAGALNAWAAVGGQAALAAKHYRDAVAASVVSGLGPLRGRPFIDLDLLFDELIAMDSPREHELDYSAPELRVLATSLETISLRVLGGFTNPAEARAAVRASMSLPRLAGEAPVVRGERMADGSLMEPIPLLTPLAEGATHVLVLRSRPAGVRKTKLSEIGERVAWAGDPALRELLRGHRDRYNRQAAALERRETWADSDVQQVAVADDLRLGAALHATVATITSAVRWGAQAMADAVLGAPIDVLWQPVVYGVHQPAPRKPESHGTRPGAVEGTAALSRFRKPAEWSRGRGAAL